MPTLRECIAMIRKITLTEYLTMIALFVMAFTVASLPVLQ